MVVVGGKKLFGEVVRRNAEVVILRRVHKDGDPMANHIEMIVAKPAEVVPMVMNYHYGELEEV